MVARLVFGLLEAIERGVASLFGFADRGPATTRYVADRRAQERGPD